MDTLDSVHKEQMHQATHPPWSRPMGQATRMWPPSHVHMPITLALFSNATGCVQVASAAESLQGKLGDQGWQQGMQVMTNIIKKLYGNQLTRGFRKLCENVVYMQVHTTTRSCSL